MSVDIHTMRFVNLSNGDDHYHKQLDEDVGRGTDTDEQDDEKSDDDFESQTLEKLQSSAPLDVVITNCMFEEDTIEVWYCLRNGNNFNKNEASFEEVEKTIKDKLQLPQGKRLILKEVRGKPVYTETAIQPGEQVQCKGSARTVGAFVKVTGHQNSVHGLVAGHGLSPGDEVQDCNSNQRVGVVECVCSQTISSGPNKGRCDAALCTVEGGIRHHVTTNGTITRYLSSAPLDPVLKNLHVEKFCDDGDQHQGRVEYGNYNSLLNSDIKKCVAVLRSTDGQRQFHGNGESGTLITTVPSENVAGNTDVVNPVAMLIGTEFVEKTEEGQGVWYSIGVPVKRTLRVLSEQQNSTIEFVNNTTQT